MQKRDCNRKIYAFLSLLIGVTKQLESVRQKSAASVATVMGTTFFLNILMGSSLSFLWGLVNTLQLIVIMLIIRADLPANSYTFF